MTRFSSFALSLILASASAWASKIPHVQETYPATQGESSVRLVSMTTPNTTALPVNPSARKKMNVATPSYDRLPPSAPTLTNPQLAGQSAAGQLAPLGPTEFDAVPQDQVDALGRRLKIVETLIRRHGRAYDYRSHTVIQLEAILKQLEGN